MPIIKIETIINAPIEVCFDLSRSIDLHKISTEHTDEQAIAGVTSGLIALNESVTWRARHLGFMQNLTTRITEYNRPTYFVDTMVKGVFKGFRHEHLFDTIQAGTKMTDYFNYASPLGLLGSVADYFFLKKYMKDLLIKRNSIIKEFAESDKWKEVL